MNCIHSYASVLGEIIIEDDGNFLTGLWFKNSPGSEKHFDCNIKPGKETAMSHAAAQTYRWLDIYFTGKDPDFTPKFRIKNLTPFRKQVIDEMCGIPFGSTTTYGEIAKKIAKENGLERMSAQAVGAAVGWNPICIVIPCHRVVGANGNLTGYGGGITNKINLLNIEGINTDKFALPKSRKFM